jgi:nicotinate-nucleotide adenylyltransferase
MKIGLYFGSFNPIHIGHLIIANFAVQETDVDKVWLVVSPHNPFKNKADLLEFESLRISVNILLKTIPNYRIYFFSAYL